MDRRDVADDALQAEVDAEVARIEADWSDDLLRSVIRTGGAREGEG
jgi:hypothetical protein